MKNELLDKGIIRLSGEISKDKMTVEELKPRIFRCPPEVKRQRYNESLDIAA